ncbi:hypothetical protein H4J02_06845 [Protaetiibacter sp. SSC-01]|uniref:hypothetical protein n=1 Tax=Protaetiibacter sp. SSC-01 TaxID=2759943 RepID=UPI0016571F85|nr:hypothetical protein [Protaetiibacter sp. SSC-01]QNO38699.1 hypothetical protein H4J02_06845 [Protaetiibacter sp. SSC-01]
MTDPLQPAPDPSAPPPPASPTPAQDVPPQYVPPQAPPPQYLAPQVAPLQYVPPAPEPPRRPLGLIVAVVLLSLGLAGAAGALVWYVLQLEEAKATIVENERRIEEQQEYVDRKDTFSASMQGLLEEVKTYEGLPFATLVSWDHLQTLAAQGWARRWDADALETTIASVEDARAELAERRAAAEAEASVDATGNPYETHLDALGAGYATWVRDDADALCASDVLACVMSDDPLLVHVDAADDAAPWMTDWIRTGLAYHEFAHVLQFTNPVETESALLAFAGDHERMADCFALTYLDGWTLDHRVWVSSFEYWDVEVGYGYVCDDRQRTTVRAWRDGLGITMRPIGAGVSG